MFTPEIYQKNCYQLRRSIKISDNSMELYYSKGSANWNWQHIKSTHCCHVSLYFVKRISLLNVYKPSVYQAQNCTAVVWWLQNGIYKNQLSRVLCSTLNGTSTWFGSMLSIRIYLRHKHTRHGILKSVMSSWWE